MPALTVAKKIQLVLTVHSYVVFRTVTTYGKIKKTQKPVSGEFSSLLKRLLHKAWGPRATKAEE